MGSAATRPSTSSPALRREYGDAGLDDPDLAADPVAMFRRWMHDTVDGRAARAQRDGGRPPSRAEGRPSSRMVLLKGVDERGFVFYTNYESRKGAELAANPSVALLFPWHDLQRQVRVEGPVERVSDEESQAYFATRPARLPARGLGLAPVAARWPRARSSTASYAEVEERFGDGRRTPAAVLGRLPGAPRGRRVLAGPQGPDARPAGLPPGGRVRMAYVAAGAVRGRCEVVGSCSSAWSSCSPGDS